MIKSDIKNITIDCLQDWMQKIGEPKYRAQQIFDWLYKPSIEYCSLNFDMMSNISKSLRSKLNEEFFIGKLKIVELLVSSDNTIKYIMRANDGICFECVAIPEMKDTCARSLHKPGGPHSLTVCVSTQAGCKMGCKFCATGKQQFFRNLTVGEIYDQVRLVSETSDTKPTNVVVMGQGEPFHNYDSLCAALNLINNSQYIGIGARKITVSTCGVIKGINRFSESDKQFGLAISLHSCIQVTRDLLMPGTINWPLSHLRCAIEDYIAHTNRRPTFEYIMIKDINDDEKHFNALVYFCKGLLCHVNLLTYNKVDGCNYKASPQSTIAEWTNGLSKLGITATHRISRGDDVAGACGQLINSW